MCECGLNSSGSGQGPETGFCEYGNGPSMFLDQLCGSKRNTLHHGVSSVSYVLEGQHTVQLTCYKLYHRGHEHDCMDVTNIRHML